MPRATFRKILADLSVASKQNKMPPKESWRSPLRKGETAREQYRRGIGARHWGAAFPIADGLTTYFATQDPHRYHFNIAKVMTRHFKDFIHTQVEAAQYAFNIWYRTLYFQNIQIQGGLAFGSKGCLTTRSDYYKLYISYYKHHRYSHHRFYREWRDAVARGIKKNLHRYIDNVTVLGLPWYPAFFAYPGPRTPYIPNVPWPLIACPSPGLKDITTMLPLKQSMLSELSYFLKSRCFDRSYDYMFEAIAQSVSLGLLLWVSKQQISLVLGGGSVPIWSPPWVPVGPVINGRTLPASGGHLL